MYRVCLLQPPVDVVSLVFSIVWYKVSCTSPVQLKHLLTSKTPLSLGSSAQLRQKIQLSFRPKPKVTMRYFCIIPKTGCVTPIVRCPITILHQTNLLIFTDFIERVQAKNRMDLPPYSTYKQSFNFRSIVLPKILFDKKQHYL